MDTEHDGAARCDYCHGIGACPHCWGRAAITRFEVTIEAALADTVDAEISPEALALRKRMLTAVRRQFGSRIEDEGAMGPLLKNLEALTGKLEEGRRSILAGNTEPTDLHGVNGAKRGLANLVLHVAITLRLLIKEAQASK